ncbi:MAG: hypothetical protein F6J98_12950 [Moorea sp. SIO4G2]|nr:hypothetical protein [Moorena sp. SIO4G2]
MNCSSFNLPYTRPLGKNNLEMFNLGLLATRSRSTRSAWPIGHAIAFKLQLFFLHPSTVTLSSDKESSNHIPEGILG